MEPCKLNYKQDTFYGDYVEMRGCLNRIQLRAEGGFNTIFGGNVKRHKTNSLI